MNNPVQSFLSLIENPLIPKFYRELSEYYDKKGEENISSALSNLIELKFNKNDTNTQNNFISGER